MIRDIDLKEISDGKLYGAEDLVKADCHDCEGCSACCQGMGNSIILDPMDCCQLTAHLGVSMEQLLQKEVELRVVEGIILPDLKMTGERECCSFLDQNGRCSIHAFRPGMCRLFPLGRVYEEGGFRYFLQTKECEKQNRTKVKVKKWIGIPDFAKYESFIAEWHYFLKDMTEILQNAADEQLARNLNLYLLNTFFLKPYDTEQDFYEQFAERMQAAKAVLEG